MKGKIRLARKGWKGGVRQQQRSIAQVLRQQRELMRRINYGQAFRKI